MKYEKQKHQVKIDREKEQKEVKKEEKENITSCEICRIRKRDNDTKINK